VTVKVDSIPATPPWTATHVKPWRRFFWPAVLLIAFVAVLAVNLIGRGGGGGGTSVQVAEAKLGPLSVDIVAMGTVEPRERIELRHAGVAAEVLEVLVREGERVKAGQLLLRVDGAPLLEAAHREEAAYLQSLDRLAEVRGGSREATLERLTLAVEKAKGDLTFKEVRRVEVAELHAAGLAAKRDQTDAEHQVDGARLAHREAQLEVEAYRRGMGAEQIAALQEEVHYRRVAAESTRRALKPDGEIAPTAGTLLEMKVRAGEMLAPGQLIAAVADMSHFQVSLFVDELEVGRLAAGQPVALISEYFGGEQVTGVVERVVPNVRDRRGVPSVEVLVRVPDNRWAPPAGLGVEARIRIDRAEGVVTVPLEAVVEREGHNVVLVAASGRAVQRPVELGLRNDSRVEVTRGIKPGEQVIVVGHVFLRDGEPVTVVAKPASGALKVEFFK
jgi:HlyD family secretion protein